MARLSVVFSASRAHFTEFNDGVEEPVSGNRIYLLDPQSGSVAQLTTRLSYGNQVRVAGTYGRYGLPIIVGHWFIRGRGLCSGPVVLDYTANRSIELLPFIGKDYSYGIEPQPGRYNISESDFMYHQPTHRLFFIATEYKEKAEGGGSHEYTLHAVDLATGRTYLINSIAPCPHLSFGCWTRSGKLLIESLDTNWLIDPFSFQIFEDNEISGPISRILPKGASIASEQGITQDGLTAYCIYAYEQRIFRVDLFREEAKDITPAGVTSTFLGPISVSPDGSTIAFPADYHQMDGAESLSQRDLYMMNSDGTGLRRATYFNEMSRTIVDVPYWCVG